MVSRSSDIKTDRTIFRSADRFVRVDGNWYFETREGNRGPYNNRAAAEGGLEHFLDTTRPAPGRKDRETSTPH